MDKKAVAETGCPIERAALKLTLVIIARVPYSEQMRSVVPSDAAILRAGLLALLAAGAVFHEARSQSAVESPNSVQSGSSATVILEVMNTHFSVGRKIRSVYLRVFTDHTAECHTVKYTGGESDIAKKGTLAPEEYERLKALIDEPELLNVKSRYESTQWRIDSWMEWDIGIQHLRRVQKIQVASFSPASARGKDQPYPDALVKLGCSVWKLRNDVYGDEPGYRNDDCKEALGIH